MLKFFVCLLLCCLYFAFTLSLFLLCVKLYKKKKLFNTFCIHQSQLWHCDINKQIERSTKLKIVMIFMKLIMELIKFSSKECYFNDYSIVLKSHRNLIKYQLMCLTLSYNFSATVHSCCYFSYFFI